MKLDPFDSVLCKPTSCWVSSVKCFVVCLYLLCTCRDRSFCPFFLAFLWLWVGHFNAWICFNRNHPIPAGKLEVFLLEVELLRQSQLRFDFLPGSHSNYCHPSVHQLFHRKKSIPTVQCCHHHVFPNLVQSQPVDVRIHTPSINGADQLGETHPASVCVMPLKRAGKRSMSESHAFLQIASSRDTTWQYPLRKSKAFDKLCRHFVKNCTNVRTAPLRWIRTICFTCRIR